MNTKENTNKTHLSFGINFRQSNYIYDSEYVQKRLVQKLKELCDTKGIAIEPYRPTGWGATGGMQSFLDILILLYHNNESLVALLSKLPMALKAIKFAVLLPGKIRNYFNERKWQKYQNDHRYDHFLNIDIHVWTQPHGSSQAIIKDSVHGSVNQILLFLPELSRVIENSYPEFKQLFSIVVIPKVRSEFIVSLRNIKANEKHRLLTLSEFDKVNDKDYPLLIDITKSKFRVEKIIIQKNFWLLSRMYDY